MHERIRANILSGRSDIITALIWIYVGHYWIRHGVLYCLKIVPGDDARLTRDAIISRLIRQCVRDRGLYVNITAGQFQALLTTARQLLCNLDMHQTLRGGGTAAFRCSADRRVVYVAPKRRMQITFLDNDRIVGAFLFLLAYVTVKSIFYI